MNAAIREARLADCSRILELINELAVYERAPEEVTVTLAEFEDAHPHLHEQNYDKQLLKG